MNGVDQVKSVDNEFEANFWFEHGPFVDYCQFYRDMKHWYKQYESHCYASQERWNRKSNDYDGKWTWRRNEQQGNFETELLSSSPSSHSSSIPASIGDSDDDSIVMEISEEMLAFLETSEKHRQQLRIQREKEQKQYPQPFTGKYTTVRNAYTGCLQESCLPPRERPGVQRTAEMKLLYGKNAAMIHGMETAMQLTFDRNCDVYQAKLWPNIPLRM